LFAASSGAALLRALPAMADPAPNALAAAQAGASDQSTTVSDIAVVGSRLNVAPQQTAQDIRIYDLQRIDDSGQATVANFLNTLPEVSINSAENTNISTTVRLRGAIQGSALVLINGRRSEPVTADAAPVGYFDLNTIPLALVQKIEVLPNGSSAVYGGDALAGVVNIQLKSDFTGLVAEGGYKTAADTDEWYVSGGGGWQKNGFKVSVLGSYSDRTPLPGIDRDLTANPDYSRFGGPNLGTTTFGNPDTVFSVSGNLPGLNSSFAAVPKGSAGVGLTPASFAGTAGTQTTGYYTTYQYLLAALRRGGLFASASYRFGPELELFAEMLASHYEYDGITAPPFFNLTRIPASNAFNPFGTAVRVSGVVGGAEALSRQVFKDDFIRPVIGARGAFRDWQWEVSALTSHDEGSQVLVGQTNAAALTAALASSTPATALNPFADGPAGSPALLGSIYSGSTANLFRGDADIVDGFVRGPLLKLPAGPLSVVLGGEYQYEHIARGFGSNRTDGAAFGELRAPLLAHANGGELLTLQLAGRYDSYSDFGGKATGQAGVELRPVDGVLIRGTYATAFKPPILANTAALTTTSTTIVTDPLLNGQLVTVPLKQGGNPELEPTTGTTSTLGLVWSPRQVPGLNASVTGWWLRIENAVGQPSSQYIVNNAGLYPGRVVRALAPAGGVGQIVSIDGTYVNFGLMQESGVDFSAEWTFRTGVGAFTPAVSATLMTEYMGATTPGTPPIDRLSIANNDGNFAPRWKALASLAWAPDAPVRLWFDGRYIGSYTDYTPPRSIGDVWYFDASLEVDLQRALNLNMPLHDLKLLVSATNLANTLPVYSTYFRGYDAYNYDIVGRTIFVRLRTRF
jgi:iron complex outermembrane receptor protein